MKNKITKILVVGFLMVYGLDTHAQSIDTLRNYAIGTKLTLLKYTPSQGWGYILGHNHNFRQQFAEKYNISGKAKVLGIVSHLQGRYSHADTSAEFNVFDVGVRKLPNNKLGGKRVKFKELNLTGGQTIVLFDTPVEVSDSFYVAFDLYDYAHGGYEGDTIGLMCGIQGSRKSADLRRFGRNVLQFHNHDIVDWRDFYTQNFTQIATHFAIYPIVEWVEPTALLDEKMGANGFVSYPSPMRDVLYIQKQSSFHHLRHVELKNLSGQTVFSKALSNQEDKNTITFDGLEQLPEGMYFLMLHSDKGVLVQKIEKE
jgi:hypothetical protein